MQLFEKSQPEPGVEPLPEQETAPQSLGPEALIEAAIQQAE